MKSGQKTEIEQYAMNMDRWFRVEVDPYSKTCFSIIFTDITNEMIKLHEVEKQEKYFQQVLLSIPDILLSVNAKGEILNCNIGQDCKRKSLHQINP